MEGINYRPEQFAQDDTMTIYLNLTEACTQAIPTSASALHQRNLLANFHK